MAKSKSAEELGEKEIPSQVYSQKLQVFVKVFLKRVEALVTHHAPGNISLKTTHDTSKEFTKTL